MAGLVFAWDMDQTLIGNYFRLDQDPVPELDFNEKALAVLRQARASPKVAAIVLYTNNTDKPFIAHVLSQIGVKFDAIIDGNRLHVPGEKHNPPKTLENIEEALEVADIDATGLKDRVYFFDDMPDHKLRDELSDPSQYILMTPPYKEGNDETNFGPALGALGALTALSMKQGGRRRRRRPTTKRRKTQKKSKRSKKI
jgi:hypothetical protein